MLIAQVEKVTFYMRSNIDIWRDSVLAFSRTFPARSPPHSAEPLYCYFTKPRLHILLAGVRVKLSIVNIRPPLRWPHER